MPNVTLTFDVPAGPGKPRDQRRVVCAVKPVAAAAGRRRWQLKSPAEDVAPGCPVWWGSHRYRVESVEGGLVTIVQA